MQRGLPLPVRAHVSTQVSVTVPTVATCDAESVTSAAGTEVSTSTMPADAP
jgi:hypothetical protein